MTPYGCCLSHSGLKRRAGDVVPGLTHTMRSIFLLHFLRFPITTYSAAVLPLLATPKSMSVYVTNGHC